MRRICVLASVGILVGCGAPATETPAAPTAIAARASEALGFRLRAVQPGYSASLVNVRATFSGGDETRSALLVVFDSELAAQQLTGKHGRIERGEVLQAGPVVLVYHSSTRLLSSARRAVEAALRGRSPNGQ